MIKKIKKLIESILEDYLDLQDKIIEIGVMTYLFQAQAGQLSSRKEKKLRQYMEEATEDIKRTIENWLGDHGLLDLVDELGGSVDSQYDRWDEIWYKDIQGLSNRLADIYTSPDDYSLDGLEKLVNDLEKAMGGSGYFGSTVSANDVLDFLNYHAEPYEDDESEDEEIIYTLNLEDEDIRDFLIDLKKKQVSQDQHFLRLAKDMVDTIKKVQSLYSYGETKDLVLAFDHLKDLEHANGSLLGDYADVDWDMINTQIEDRVKRLVKV